MSDPKPTDSAKPESLDPEPQGEPAGDEPLGEGGKRALQSERERAKELEKQLGAATAKLAEIERANESALEKAQREAQEARDEVAGIPSLVADQLKAHLVSLHDISDEDSELFLTANDPDVLLKQVSRLVERATTSPTTPKPDHSQGGSGGPPTAAAADQFAAAFEGRL